MITVIGLGFVGLTTALGFSKKGFRTYGIDIDKSRLTKLRNFEIPFLNFLNPFPFVKFPLLRWALRILLKFIMYI